MSRMLIIIFSLSLTACQQSAEWAYQEAIHLDEGKPIDVFVADGYLKVADAANNRIVKLDRKGKIIEEYPGFRRPMHLGYSDGQLYITEYLADTIKIMAGGKVDVLPVSRPLNAPAGVAARHDAIAVADFYNHRVVLDTQDSSRIIGSKGHGKGKLFYPTDVAFTKDRLLIADAYNNRLQAWDREQKTLSVVYQPDSLQTVSGVEAGKDAWFVTNSDKGTVHIISKNGDLRQVLRKGIDYPTGLAVSGDHLYVADFHEQRIVIYKKQ